MDSRKRAARISPTRCLPAADVLVSRCLQIGRTTLLQPARLDDRVPRHSAAKFSPSAARPESTAER